MSKNSIKLSAKWQLDAALLSRPVDLTALVSMSRSSPEKFLEDNTLPRLVTVLLNEKNSQKSDKDTKLDVLSIMANVAAGSKASVSAVRSALQGVSEWFDDYMAEEDNGPGQEPELNKAMVLLLARCWEYRLKTEDVLELTQGNRKIALCTVVGLLEDGETYSTELKQRQKPSQGKMGQWEHELVCHRFEKPLVLQICRLLRGFTHPGTYFESSPDGEIALYSVEKFADEMDTLLEITLRSNLVEKLSMALYDCLFEYEDSDNEGKYDGYSLEEYDHTAVASVHAFLQNLYFYATRNTDEYRKHLLMETLLIPRLILPYLDRCVIHATILNTRAEAYADMLENDRVAEMALHNPQLVKGIAASLRTLILASFRAPLTQFVMTLLRKLNPTSQMLRASAFCRYHDYIFALLCMLNVNMGALDISHTGKDSDDEFATLLLGQLASIFSSMDKEKQSRVCRRVMYSGALPISRDTPSYAAIISVLHGGAAGQLNYASGRSVDLGATGGIESEDTHFKDTRAEAKRAHAERMNFLRQSDDRVANAQSQLESSEPKQSAFQIAVSVANASEHKESKGLDSEAKSSSDESKNKYRLLGDLPSLNQKDKQAHERDVQIALSLELHNDKKDYNFMKSESKVSSDAKGLSAKDTDPTLPKEFLCAINGHVMKEPMRVKSTGLVFEAATIELWLKTRGSVCPITNTPLEWSDLEPDEELKNRIKRYHIQQITQRTTLPDDDIYDF